MAAPSPVVDLCLLLGELRSDRAMSPDRRLRARQQLVNAIAAIAGRACQAKRLDAEGAKGAFDALWDELSARGANPVDLTSWAAEAAERNNRPRGR